MILLNWLNKNIDKIAHESLSNLICWIIFIPIFFIIQFWAILPAMIISFIVGLNKEDRDSKFDKKDMLANGIGILRFCIQIGVVSLLFSRF